jgi:transcriptional regulator with GAF, ATPase, and Fis domain
VGVPVRVSDPSSASQATSKVDLLFAMLEMESLLTVPLTVDGGLLFVASADTLDETHIAAATDLARHLAAVPQQEDTPADLERRLVRFDALADKRVVGESTSQSKPGQLQPAAGGTLSLDEVAPDGAGQIPARAAGARIPAPGGTRVLRTDARIVAATTWCR